MRLDRPIDKIVCWANQQVLQLNHTGLMPGQMESASMDTHLSFPL